MRAIFSIISPTAPIAEIFSATLTFPTLANIPPTDLSIPDVTVPIINIVSGKTAGRNSGVNRKVIMSSAKNITDIPANTNMHAQYFVDLSASLFIA